MYKESKHDAYTLGLGRRLTGPWRALPDFLVIGAQKAGTTTIYDNLVKHPQVAAADIKEVHFFDNNWERGVNWYRAHFELERRLAAQSMITGEGSPYYLFHPLTPQRVKQLCPAVKLIAIFRNPVDRAYSHYHHEKRKGREPLSFEDALAQEEQRLAGEEERIVNGGVMSSFAHQHFSYKARGNYARQMRKWLEHFPREQFLLLESGALNRDFSATFRRVYDFLELPHHELPEPKRSNVGSYDKMVLETRAELTRHFAPMNEELFEIVGERFNW
jgi:hypothetical protein